MKSTRIFVATFLLLTLSATAAVAEEGMWRLDQLPLEVIHKYGLEISESGLLQLRHAPVRILSGLSGGTGTFASPSGLILTNHHVALDCIRTSTLAEQSEGEAENLIRNGFTAGSRAEELSCKQFRVQVERSTRDVTAELDAVVSEDMDAAQIQMARQTTRSDLERACQSEKGDNYRCEVVDFNSGAFSLLIVYEEYRDVRLVYAPEKQLGYFGGDEMNFRFPRYVSDISILRAYRGTDGTHGPYDPDHVPVRPEQYLRVSFDGVEEDDLALVAGFPGNTNRYRMSFSARYNVTKGIPEQIRDIETELELLKKYTAMTESNEVILQSRIFGLANTLKYQRDVWAALKESNVTEARQRREEEFTAYLNNHPDAKAEYGGVLASQGKVYSDDVEANDALDQALGWLQRSTILNYATGLYEFAVERAKTSDRDREPQFQERNWPRVREVLANDDPVIIELEREFLTLGFEQALALGKSQRIAAVDGLRDHLASRAAAGKTPTAKDLADALLDGTQIPSVEMRRSLLDAESPAFEESTDPMLAFARSLGPALKDQRQRIRVLNEKLFINRAKFARGMVAWKGDTLYPDANFTLRATFGSVKGYVDRKGVEVPFTTDLEGLFGLAEKRGNAGDYELPAKLVEWRQSLDEGAFEKQYASLPVNFVSTNDITGGNSGSALLNAKLQIVGLVFDGNEESMAGDWTYGEGSSRTINTDIRFALTVAREVHGAGWVVDELTKK